jgi:hypothetical protein
MHACAAARWSYLDELKGSLRLVQPEFSGALYVADAEAHWARQAAYTMRDTLNSVTKSGKNVLLELQNLFHGYMRTSHRLVVAARNTTVYEGRILFENFDSQTP